jgi:hypothetical protein
MRLDIPICAFLISFVLVGGFRATLRPLACLSCLSSTLEDLNVGEEAEVDEGTPLEILEGYLDASIGECYRTHKASVDGGNTGDSMSSRDKEGTWLLPTYLARIKDFMNNTMLANVTSDGVQFLASSSFPATTTMLYKDSYELTVLSVPGSGTHAPRRHTSGAIVLYTRLWGDTNMRTVVITQNPREDTPSVRQIKREVVEEDTVLHRMAGLSRILEANAGVPAAILELVIYPPSSSDEGFRDAVDRFEVDMGGQVLKVDAGESFKRDFFAPRGSGDDGDEAPEEDKGEGKGWEEAGLLTEYVGGLGEEVNTIARRILLSRTLPKAVVDSYGQEHVRGVLMYGPPGCGKTLIARHLATLVGAPPERVKIVNGPEVFDKFVGEAERNVRALFEEANEAWETLGHKSPLYVIIMDELDSIAKTRTGGSGSGDGSSVRDSVVNTLLAQLDGVSQRSNVLVVGLTNRKDMLDPALLRPGRLEVHLPINLPSAEDRLQILDIHTRSLRENGIVDEEDYRRHIAGMVVARTEGCTGADLAGLVRNAASLSMQRLARSHTGQPTGTASASASTAGRGPHISLQVGGATIDFTDRDRDVRDAALRMKDEEQFVAKTLLDKAHVTASDFETALVELGGGSRRQRKRDRLSKWWISLFK